MPHPEAPCSRNGTQTRNHGCAFTPALLILCTKRPKANKQSETEAKRAGSDSLGSSYPKFKREENRKVSRMPNFTQAIITQFSGFLCKLCKHTMQHQPAFQPPRTGRSAPGGRRGAASPARETQRDSPRAARCAPATK